MKPFLSRTSALLPLLLAATAMGAEPGSSLSRISPFNRAAAAGGTVEAANEAIEFAAVSTIGKKTELVFFDKVAKKNHWIAKGETKGGIALLNYDASREQAVVKINGLEKTLSLRKAHGPAGAGRVVAAVPTGFNVATPNMTTAPAILTAATVTTPLPQPTVPAAPQTQAQQETEARMLVSDLLEIGMAQRKAYEEKQKQAGGGEPAAQTPAGDTPTKQP